MSEYEYRIRKLTPKECWRLMGFSDESFDKAKSSGVSNSQLYKQAGNSIVTDTLYHIYQNIYDAMPYLFEDLKLTSLFSGIGAFEIALNKLFEINNLGEWELVNFCEFDKYAEQSYCAVHNVDKSFNLGDITKVNEKKIDDFTMMCGGSPCFTGDTLVLTNKGYIPIKDIQIGDKVLTHSNEYQTVTESMMTGNKNIYKINAMCFDEIRCTDNHKFYIRTKHRKCTHIKGVSVNFRWFENPIWKECKDLTKDDYLGYAINQNSIIPKWDGITLTWSDNRLPRHSSRLNNLMDNKDFWWIIGRYIADGWVRNDGGIVICCGYNKVGQIDKHLELCGLHYTTSDERTVRKYHIRLSELKEFVKQFGYKAYGKYIPSFVLDMPIDLLESFLTGYMSGDGSYIESKSIYKATTVSRELVYGLGQIVAKVYHRPFAIYYNKRPKTCVIEGRVCNQRDTYMIVYKKNNDKQDHAFYEDGYIWFPIKSITNTNVTEDVYDITVNQDHSFTANGAIVHNCQDFSLAGRQAGAMWTCKDCGHTYNPLEAHYNSRDYCPKCSSENIEKTRSSLLVEYLRILREKHPKFAMYENVKNIVGKQFKPTFDLFVNEMNEYGYNCYYKVLNAKDYGIPQNRERIYIFIVDKELDNGKFKFPEPFDNGLRLKDMLEDEVDEKFYITNDNAKRLISELAENGTLEELENNKFDKVK